MSKARPYSVYIFKGDYVATEEQRAELDGVRAGAEVRAILSDWNHYIDHGVRETAPTKAVESALGRHGFHMDNVYTSVVFGRSYNIQERRFEHVFINIYRTYFNPVTKICKEDND